MIQRNMLWAVVIVALALLQYTWLDALRLGDVVPDLTVLLVVYFALNGSIERAILTGALAGVFHDVIHASVLGHHVLVYVAVGYAAGQMSARLVLDHPAVKAGLVFLAALSAGVLYFLLNYVQHPSAGLLAPLVKEAVPQAFYTALATPIVFAVLNRLFGERQAEPVEKTKHDPA
jgi:rod shape-determining protein MreD